MLIHLFEAVLNGVLLLVCPLVVVAAMAGLLTLIDRLYYALWETRSHEQCHRERNVFTAVLLALDHATPHCANWVKSLSLGPAGGWAQAHPRAALHKKESRQY